jgi:predicted small lipoprotein YifL
MRHRTHVAGIRSLSFALALSLALALGGLLVSGCGQTGPLTLSEPASVPADAEPDADDDAENRDAREDER